jgi:hypothetical protein
MRKVRRKRIPEAVMAPLVKPVRQREIAASQLVLPARWLDANPEVTAGKWLT